MDENWPLFAARIARRSPTRNEERLLNASRRLWSAALAWTQTKLSESPAFEGDAEGITTKIWEETLFSVLEMVDRKLGNAQIQDLDSYLFRSFTNGLTRFLVKERRRQKVVELVPSVDDLADLEAAQDTTWVERIDSQILLREALDIMDDTFRMTVSLYCSGYHWNEIGEMLGMTAEQAKKRYQYGVQKLQKLVPEIKVRRSRS